MSTAKLQVDSLPLTIAGKIELVPRRQYVNHRAQELTIQYKADIKKGSVSDMIDMIVAGKELDSEAPDYAVWSKVYDAVKNDIDLAQDKAAEAVEAANQAAEAEKLKKEQSELAEKRLVEVATSTDVASTFATLADKFDLGNMDRCVPKEGTTDEDLMSALVAGMGMENFSNWAKGDLVSELEKRGHEKAMVTLCESTGIPYKTVYRMAITARNVPPDQRKAGVSFTTYAEIAMAKFTSADGKALAPEKNKEKVAELVEKIGEKVKTGDEKADAEANAKVITTAQEARKAVQTAQGKQAPTPPDPNRVDYEKDKFILVNHDAGTVETCTAFPHSVADDDSFIIIHAKTGRKSYDYKVKTKESKWSPLEEYQHPAPEPEAQPAAPATKGKGKQPAAAPAAQPAPAAKKKAAGKK